MATEAERRRARAAAKAVTAKNPPYNRSYKGFVKIHGGTPAAKAVTKAVRQAAVNAKGGGRLNLKQAKNTMLKLGVTPGEVQGVARNIQRAYKANLKAARRHDRKK